MKYFALKDLRTDKGKVSAGQIFFSNEVLARKKQLKLLLLKRGLKRGLNKNFFPIS